MAATVRLLSDERMDEHVNGPGHPERPERLVAVRRRLEAAAIAGVEWATPRAATADEIARVHDPAYVARIETLHGRSAPIDIDTGVAPGSVAAACLAAGAALGAVETVFGDGPRRAFALVRPPGHHAEFDRAMGFCLFNNIAVGAAHALATHACARVLIVDWDVHHGNGTQHAFEARDDVLFASTHRDWFYPGTGAADECGIGAGTGYTINVPLPAGTGDEGVLDAWERVLAGPVAEYEPELVLVSAGFDAHGEDPLGGFTMTDGGFARLCAMVRDVADRFAEGRLVLVLEGGYDLGALARSVEACVRVMAE